MPAQQACLLLMSAYLTGIEDSWLSNVLWLDEEPYNSMVLQVCYLYSSMVLQVCYLYSRVSNKGGCPPSCVCMWWGGVQERIWGQSCLHGRLLGELITVSSGMNE